jgi:FtsZ-binding cell division protein ZapB
MDAQTNKMTPAQMKMKELKRKEQIASEVTPCLKDITTIKRRIANLKGKLLIRDIERQLDSENAKTQELDPAQDYHTNLNAINEHFKKLEGQIQIRLENL